MQLYAFDARRRSSNNIHIDIVHVRRMRRRHKNLACVIILQNAFRLSTICVIFVKLVCQRFGLIENIIESMIFHCGHLALLAFHWSGLFFFFFFLLYGYFEIDRVP
jgi:hypothetical protein